MNANKYLYGQANQASHLLDCKRILPQEDLFTEADSWWWSLNHIQVRIYEENDLPFAAIVPIVKLYDNIVFYINTSTNILQI